MELTCIPFIGNGKGLPVEGLVAQYIGQGCREDQLRGRHIDGQLMIKTLPERLLWMPVELQMGNARHVAQHLDNICKKERKVCLFLFRMTWRTNKTHNKSAEQNNEMKSKYVFVFISRYKYMYVYYGPCFFGTVPKKQSQKPHMIF